MKVKKQGWINIYQDLKGEKYGLAIYSTKAEALETGVVHHHYVTTTKIEWEEEE